MNDDGSNSADLHLDGVLLIDTLDSERNLSNPPGAPREKQSPQAHNTHGPWIPLSIQASVTSAWLYINVV